MNHKHPFLSRRELLQYSAALSATALFPWFGCSSSIPRSNAETAVAPESWLDQYDPINRLNPSASVFSGDDPTAGHYLRDNVLTPAGIKPERSVKLAIVGGGSSGLACAYLFRQDQPVVLERAARFGGNAKGESWGGVDYTIGAAYLTEGDESSRLLKEFYQPLGIDKKWHMVSNEQAELRGKITHMGS
jgi:hypothetical protein